MTAGTTAGTIAGRSEAEPEHDVAGLYDSDSTFALATQGPLTAPDAVVDPDSYRRLVLAFCRGVVEAAEEDVA